MRGADSISTSRRWRNSVTHSPGFLAWVMHRPCAVNQQRSHVGVTALAAPQQLDAPDRAHLSRDQPGEGGELPPKLECLGIPRDGDGSRGSEWPDAGNLGNPFTSIIMLESKIDALLDGSNLAVHLLDACPLIA